MQPEQTPETKLALQAKDIVYLGQTVSDLKKTVEDGFKAQRDDMKWMRDNSVLRVEFDKELKDMSDKYDTEIKRIDAAVTLKTDQKDFTKLTDNLTKLLWVFVTPAAAAAIGIIIYVIGKFATK